VEGIETTHITVPVLSSASPPPVHKEGGIPVDQAVVAGTAQLSRRERQVLVYMADGLTYDAIAQRMQLSRHTVDTYIRRIRAKTGARSRMQLLMHALPLMTETRRPAAGETAPGL
jgi:DNA-binding CsgD family transcriptional regulator